MVDNSYTRNAASEVMENNQFQKGLANVLQAIEVALRERKVEGAVVTHDAPEGARQTVTVTVSVGGKSEVQHFAAEELEDCGQAIDAPAAIKVRMLVGPFVR